MKKLRLASVLTFVTLLLTGCYNDIADDEMEPETLKAKTHAKRKVAVDVEGGDTDPIIDYRSRRFIKQGSQNAEEHDANGHFGCYVYWERRSLRSIDMNNQVSVRPVDGHSRYYQGNDENILTSTAKAQIEEPIDINQNGNIKVTFEYSKKVFYRDEHLLKDTFRIEHHELSKTVSHYFEGEDENDM